MSHLQWQRREKFSFLHIMKSLGVDYSRSTMLDYFLTPGESTLVDRLWSTMKYPVKTDLADFDDFSRTIVDSILPWLSKNRLDYNPSTIVDSRQKKAKEIPQKMPNRLRTISFDYIRVDYLPSLLRNRKKIQISENFFFRARNLLRKLSVTVKLPLTVRR